MPRPGHDPYDDDRDDPFYTEVYVALTEEED